MDILASWQGYVAAIEAKSVFVMTTSYQDPFQDDEIEIPKGKFIRMFGNEALMEGQIVNLVLKQHDNGRVTLRGWPYKRKWTEAEIAQANEEANRLWRAAWGDAEASSNS